MAYGASNQILDASEAVGKNTNSIMEGWVDRGPWQYYDTVIGAAGTALAASYSMFSIAVGQFNPATNLPQTKLNTNMVRGNQFAPPRCLLLFSLGIYFSSAMLKSDIDLIMDNCLIEFKIDEKTFHEGPMYNYPGGAGLTGVSTNNGESVYTNGVPTPFGSRRYDEWSKYIAPLQQFSLNVNFYNIVTPTGAVRFQATLDGLTDRSVQ